MPEKLIGIASEIVQTQVSETSLTAADIVLTSPAGLQDSPRTGAGRIRGEIEPPKMVASAAVQAART